MESFWPHKAKEPGPYFHLSLDPTPISDLMHPYLGMYQVPFFGYYGPNFPCGDMVCIVRGGREHIRLPEEVQRAIAGAPEVMEGSKPVKADRDRKFVPKEVRVPRVTTVRTHFIVSDISQLIQRKGTVLNLVDHAWVFKDWTQKRLFRDVPKCIFPVSGFTEIYQRGVKFNSLRCEYMSMHTKGGALCISPNNHRVQITPDAGVCKCWTLAIDTEREEAVVSLQWLICGGGEVGRAFGEARTIEELVGMVPELGDVFSLPS